MPEQTSGTHNRTVLLLYYGAGARERLEAALVAQNLEVYAIDGRSEDAITFVREHPSPIVVMDRGATDVSVTQAVRQLGQILPESVVLTVYPRFGAVDVYRSGHRVGEAADLETALRIWGYPSISDAEHEASPDRKERTTI